MMQRILLSALALGIIALAVLGIVTYRAKTVLDERGASLALGVPQKPLADENSEGSETTPAVVAAPPEEHRRLPLEITDPSAVEKAAERAAELTGVRKEFILGALTVETMLGENVGKCTYKQVSDGAEAAHRNGQLSGKSWETFQRRREQIESIAADLGYEVEGLKVSCNPNPNQYTGTGGAMGISQFMPSTWYEYKDRIAKISGKEHPDPWDVEDGVMAMALKLGDVPGVTEHNRAAEKKASKMYLSGSVSQKYEWYANDIQYWAENNHEILGEQYIMSLIFQQ